MSAILALSGSTRRDSFNTRLLAIAVEAARAAGATVTVADLAAFPMPIFDQDAEAAAGLPDGARKLRALLDASRGVLIASPEYNSSLTPLLKNAIDWTSRSAGAGDAPLASWQGRHAGLVAASPGQLGGLRGLFHLREILQNIRVHVLPDPYMVAVPKAHEAFAADGRLKDEKLHAAVESVGRRLAEAVR